jgi:acyl dehydratase
VASDATFDVAGPFFEDLQVGLRVHDVPALTLTSGHAALHQAILGGRLRLALDGDLSREVVGAHTAILHPGLVCDVAIGQSTLLTRRVIANLFYRGLVLWRTPLVGDTLRTSTEVVALRQTSPKPSRPATGLAALRIRTIDQEERRVLDFWRCAMLPLRDPEGSTGQADDLANIAPQVDHAALGAAVRGWRLERFRELIGGYDRDEHSPGTVWRVLDGDVVSSAPELARLTLNVAAAHHDAASTAAGRRLVYGGHTIGIAAAQATRALPDLVTFVAWHGCDHVAPVYEEDTLTSTLELERIEPLEDASPASLLHLRSRVYARREGQDAGQVLDWRFVAVSA